MHSFSPALTVCCLSLFAGAPLNAETVGPFTIAEERGAIVAAWTGDAGTVVEGAPTAEDIAALATHPEIEAIVIKGNTLLDGKGFGALSQLPKLRRFSFGSCGPSRFSTLFGETPDFSGLTSLDQVTTIGLDHLMISIDGAAEILSGMSGLETFGVGVMADDRILQAAAGAPQLTSLSFGHWKTVPPAQLTMEGFRQYAKMPQLTNLQTGALIPADGSPSEMFEVIGSLPNLTALKLPIGGYLDSTQKPSPEKPTITKEDLLKLKNAPNLRFVGLYAATFAPGALSAFESFPDTLNVIELFGCVLPTDEFEALQTARPTIRFNVRD